MTFWNASIFGREVMLRNTTRNGDRVQPTGTHVAARAIKWVDSLRGKVGAPPAEQSLVVRAVNELAEVL